MYEDSLKQLKASKKTDGYNFRSKSRLKYDNNTLQNAVSKSRTYLANQQNEIELTSMDEAYLMCEALRQIYIQDTLELNKTFINLSERIKDIEAGYERLLKFGDELENEDEHQEMFTETNEIEVDGLNHNNPFNVRTPSQTNLSDKESKNKLTNENFSLIKPKTSSQRLEQLQNLKEPIRNSNQEDLTKQKTTRDRSEDAQTPKISQRALGPTTKNLSPLKPVVSQLKAQDLQKFFLGQAKLTDLSQKDQEKSLEMDPRFKKSVEMKPRNEGGRLNLNESPVNPNGARWNTSPNNRPKLDDLRNLLRPNNK